MKNTTNTLRAAWLIAATAIALAGCIESSRPQAVGRGNIRGINAVVSSPPLTFVLEERGLAQLDYKGGSGDRFDSLPYNVSFDYRVPGATVATRVATERLEVAADTEYLVSVNGTIAAPTILVWQQPDRIWDGSETVFEISFGHLAGSVGPVDVYFDAPGVAPAAGNARGTIARDDFIPGIELPGGSYQMILTAPNDPANILYTSPVTAPNGAISLTYVLFDADPSITGSIAVSLLRQAGGSADQPDQNAPPTIRTYHAAFGTGNYDAFLNGNFTTPVAANIAFRGISGDANGIVGDNAIRFTAAGNPGAILNESTAPVVTGFRYTMMLAGQPGNLVNISMPDDRRPEEVTGKLRLVQAASNAPDIDIYITDPATDITDVRPNFAAVPAFVATSYVRVEAANLEVLITTTGEKTVIAGPLALDFTAGGIAELVLLDTADPNVLMLTEW